MEIISPYGKTLLRINISNNFRVIRRMSEETAKGGLILLHPVRWKIYQTLKANEKSMYIDQIAKAISEDRRLISFHLSTLEDNGFVDSEFKVIKKAASKGKAGRFYKLTSKADETLHNLTELLKT